MKFTKGDCVHAVAGNRRGCQGRFVIDNADAAFGGSYLVYKEGEDTIIQLREVELCRSIAGHHEDPCKFCGQEGWEAKLKSLS